MNQELEHDEQLEHDELDVELHEHELDEDDVELHEDELDEDDVELLDVELHEHELDEDDVEQDDELDDEQDEHVADATACVTVPLIASPTAAAMEFNIVFISAAEILSMDHENEPRVVTSTPLVLVPAL